MHAKAFITDDQISYSLENPGHSWNLEVLISRLGKFKAMVLESPWKNMESFSQVKVVILF